MLFVAGHNFQTNRRKPFPASRPVPSNPLVERRGKGYSCSKLQRIGFKNWWAIKVWIKNLSMFVLMVRKEHGVCVSSRVLYIYICTLNFHIFRDKCVYISSCFNVCREIELRAYIYYVSFRALDFILLAKKNLERIEWTLVTFWSEFFHFPWRNEISIRDLSRMKGRLSRRNFHSRWNNLRFETFISVSHPLVPR